MSSILFWGAICVIGPIVYTALGGETHPITLETSDERYKRYIEETYGYFLALPLEYQEKYFKENLDLRYYKDDSTYGLTDNKYLNAKHAAEISRITGKPFTDIHKTY